MNIIFFKSLHSKTNNFTTLLQTKLLLQNETHGLTLRQNIYLIIYLFIFSNPVTLARDKTCHDLDLKGLAGWGLGERVILNKQNVCTL